MKVCVIGTGYVGLVTGVCLAQIGHTVTCVDNQVEKVAQLQSGKSPIFEPGLEPMMPAMIPLLTVSMPPSEVNLDVLQAV